MFRVAGLYIVGAWVIIEVADVLFPAWGIPDTALRFLIIAAALCFPIALVFGWIFDITSDGIVRTRKAGEDDSPDTKLQRLDYIILTAFLGLGGVVLFGSAEKVMDEIEKTPTSTTAIEKLDNSIAILPFENLDSNPDTGYFSDGVAEEILQKLSSLKTLHVLARTSSFAFKGSDLGPAQISDFLGVRYMLQGSVRRDKDTVRITARLVDDTGFQIWSESFDRKLEGIFAIQKEIATTVARRIVNEITSSAETSLAAPTTNMDAYNAYLIGRSYLNSRVPGWREPAETAFRRAIELDDQFAPPYAGLAVSMSVMTYQNQETFDEAWHLAETSVRLDPELAEGHAAVGLLSSYRYRRDLEASENSLRFAIELDPSLSAAYSWLAGTLRRQGRFSDAEEVQDKGLAIDPLNPLLTANIASRFSFAGGFDRAEQLLLRLTQLPETPNPVYHELHDLYQEYGRFGKAITIKKKHYRAAYRSGDGSHFSAILALAASYYRLGMVAEGDYYLGLGTAPLEDDFDRFMERAFSLENAGEIERLRTLVEMTLPELDLDQQPEWVMVDVGQLQIASGNYEAGIRSMEIPFDVMSLEIFEYNNPLLSTEIMQSLAFAYEQTGRTAESNQLLIGLQERLDEMANSGLAVPSFFATLALNQALLGDAEGALQNFETAVDNGFRNYYRIIDNPVWSGTLELPGFAELLDEMKQDLNRQRVLVEQADAEDNFRAEIEKLELR